MTPEEAVAAAHTDARNRIERAKTWLRMAEIDPGRMSHREACERALSDLEGVQQVALILREVEVEKPTVDDPGKRQMFIGETLNLSDREMQILRLMADGKSNAQIGSELHLSPMTIKSHARRIYGKLDVTSRTGAVSEAIRRGALEFL